VAPPGAAPAAPPVAPDPHAGEPPGSARFVAWEDQPAPAATSAAVSPAASGAEASGEGVTAANILEGLCSRCGQPSRRGLCETCEAAFKELKELTFGYDEEF
jgi:hypothetical protein